MKLAEGGPISDKELELLLLEGDAKLMEKAAKCIQVRIVLDSSQAWRCPWEH